VVTQGEIRTLEAERVVMALQHQVEQVAHVVTIMAVKRTEVMEALEVI